MPQLRVHIWQLKRTQLRPGPGLPWWLRGKESSCQWRRHRFDPWSGKVPHASEQLNPWATITEPVLETPGAESTEPTHHDYWSPRALEPVFRNKRSHHSEKQVESNSCLPQLERSRYSNKEIAQPEINRILKKRPSSSQINTFLKINIFKKRYSNLEDLETELLEGLKEWLREMENLRLATQEGHALPEGQHWKTGAGTPRPGTEGHPEESWGLRPF